MAGTARSRTIDQAITDFLAKYRKNPKTRQAYANTLRLAEHMLAGMRVHKVQFMTAAHIEKLFQTDEGFPGLKVPRRSDMFDPASAVMEPIAPGTINNHIRRFGTWINWLHKNSYINDGDLMKDIDFEYVDDDNKVRLNEEQLLQLLAAADNPRDRALIACATFSMRRIDEITKSLCIKHIDIDDCEIRFKDRKNKKPIVVPMYEEFAEALREWFEYYERRVGTLAPDMLVIPRMDRPVLDGKARSCSGPDDREIFPYLPYTGENEMLVKVFERAGIEKPRGQSWHIFRRTGARRFYDSMIAEGRHDALRLVQTFLGHATQAMTERYIGMTADQEKVFASVKGKRFFSTPHMAEVVQFPTREAGAEAS